MSDKAATIVILFLIPMFAALAALVVITGMQEMIFWCTFGPVYLWAINNAPWRIQGTPFAASFYVGLAVFFARLHKNPEKGEGS